MALLRSKFAPPGVPPHAVQRGRLLERIHEQFWHLVLLHAPGGYGKSILAAQVRAAEPAVTAWLHLDADDSDPRRLCRYLSAAVAEVAPQILQTELPTSPDRPEFEIDAWTEDFLLFLEEMTQERIRLVLDNFETVAGEAGVNRFLQRVLDPGADRFQLLIGTRQAPDVRLSRMIGAQKAISLGADDLAFDLDEYKEAAAAHGIKALDEQLEKQWSASQGWCVLLGLGGGRGSREALSQGSAYVQEEVLNRLPNGLRDFLVKTSVLELLTPTGAEAIGIPPGESETRMEEIVFSGVPHLVVDQDRGIRIHPLVRDLLLGDLQRSPAEVASVARAAATYHCKAGRFDSAVGILARLERYDDLLQQIEDVWMDLDRNSMLMRVEGWLRLLPESHHSHPLYVSHLTAYCALSGHHRRALETIQRLRDEGIAFEEWDVYPRLWTSEARSKVHLAEGDGYEAMAKQWARLAPRADRRAKLMATGAFMLAALYELRYEKALEHAEEALQLIPDDQFQVRASAKSNIAVVLQELGRSDEVEALSRENVAECRRRGEQFYCEVNLVGLAWSLKESGRFREALETLGEAEELARQSGSTRPQIVPHALRTRGEILWHQGRQREGLDLLEKAYRGFLESNRFEALGTGVAIDHWKSLSGESSNLVGEDEALAYPRSEFRIRYDIRRARLDAGQGKVEAAVRRLEATRKVAVGMAGWLMAIWFTEAWAWNRGDRYAESHRALIHGLTGLDQLGWGHYPLADPELTAWIIVEATATDRFTDAAERLIRGALSPLLSKAVEQRILAERTTTKEASRLVAAATRWRLRGLENVLSSVSELDSAVADAYRAMVAEAPLPPLQVRLFGELEVFADGRSVRFPRKASRVLLEMLLLDYPNPVHEERLMDAIWPEAEPKSAKRSLQTAVNDLRRALDPFHRPLGDSYVLYKDESYRLQLPAGSEVDFHDFMRQVQAGISGTSGGSRKMLDTSALAASLDLYRGELIADAPYAEHVVEAREQARTLFLDGIATWVVAVGSRETTDAVLRLERGLQTDPYWAEGLKLLMECLRREGRVLAALRRYRTFERKLSEELGADPDREVRETYESLTGKRALPA